MKPLTGRKVLAIAVGFFGVIFVVNFYMASRAIGTFPGLEVQNSFVASQYFNEEQAAQLALGWEIDAQVENGELSIAFTNAEGSPVEVAGMTAILGRATHVRDDMQPEFSYSQGVFRAPVEIAPGNWNIRLVATAPDGTQFRQRVVLHVSG